jgi:hypothetical protein
LIGELPAVIDKFTRQSSYMVPNKISVATWLISISLAVLIIFIVFHPCSLNRKAFSLVNKNKHEKVLTAL